MEPEQTDAEHYEFNEADRVEPQLSGHAWRQRGPWLVCTSCPFEHSSAIQPDYMLVGIDEGGLPIFQKIE